MRKIKFIYYLIKLLLRDFNYFMSFLKNYNNDEEVIFCHLRTHTHILDKGLNVIPFEKGHSEKTYKNCIHLQDKIINNEILNDRAYLWADNVIKKYEKAQVEPQEEEQETIKNITVKEKELFFDIIRSRISCRNFSPKTIPDEIWDEIIEISLTAPSGCCRQSSRYYIENNEKNIQLLKKNIAGLTGFGKSIPYLICVTSDIRPYEIKDRFLPYIETSLNIQNFLLACTANNICTTVLNFQHAEKNEIENVRKILTIPRYENIIAFIAAGYPIKLPQQPVRISTKWIRKK